MTADAKAVATNLRGSLYRWEYPILEEVNKWVSQQNIDLENGINIVMRDFIDRKFTTEVIRRNLW